jgi:hypothetical protein
VVKEFHKWRRHLERCAGEGVAWFYTLETGASGHLHIHGLLNYPASAPQAQLRTWRWGFSRVERLRSLEGAVRYRVKHIARSAFYDRSRPAMFRQYVDVTSAMD